MQMSPPPGVTAPLVGVAVTKAPVFWFSVQSVAPAAEFIA